MKKVILKKDKEKKVLNFYQWIFKDDIAGVDDSIAPGEEVEILSANGIYVGRGFFNPDAAIPIRVITNREESIDEALSRHLQRALNRRKHLSTGRYVAGEADFIPGLIIDRFENYFVIQTRNPGIHKKLDLITQMLIAEYQPEGIILRNDFETLREKHIPREIKTLHGKLPEKPILVNDGEVRLLVDIVQGQKTGFFFDQSANREKVHSRVRNGQKGLDLYCYTGSFALHAAKAGAHVEAVDISAEDLQLAKENAELNGLSDRINFVHNDVSEFLAGYNQQVDFIICDPPALAKRKNELNRIQYVLVDLLMNVLKTLKPDGWSVIFSCSYILDINFMLNTIRIAASKVNVPVFLEDITFQNPDHPILLQMPETLYLKGFWIRKGEY